MRIICRFFLTQNIQRHVYCIGSYTHNLYDLLEVSDAEGILACGYNFMELANGDFRRMLSVYLSKITRNFTEKERYVNHRLICAGTVLFGGTRTCGTDEVSSALQSAFSRLSWFPPIGFMYHSPYGLVIESVHLSEHDKQYVYRYLEGFSQSMEHVRVIYI